MSVWIMSHAKGTAWLWVAICGVGAVWLNVAGIISLPVVIIFYLVAAFIGGIGINAAAGICGLRPALKAASEACDPEPLLQFSQIIVRQNAKSTLYRLHEGWAFLALGREDEAANVLKGLEEEKRLWRNTRLLPMYCICRADLADVEEAALWLERLEQTAGSLPMLDNTLKEQRACLALRRGETEGLEPIFQAGLEKASVLQGRVAWHFELGKLYLAQGRREEAAEHLRYVAEHGNKLAVRAEAEELLKTL